MSWRDKLLPSSFRGAQFFFEDTALEGGRRLADHEFPLRDDAYVEDLGKRNRRYHITGYVLSGDDYMPQRDALLSALEAEGEATLNHPYLGLLTVNADSFRMRETRGEGGMARFEMEFVDAGTNPSPTSGEDTANSSFDTGEDTFDQGETDFGNDWSAGSESDFGILLLDQLELALQPLVNWPGIDTSAIADLIADLSGKVADAAAIAAAVRGFFSGFSDAAAAVANVPVDPHFTSRGQRLNENPSYGLAALAQWGNTLAQAIGTHHKELQAAIIALVETSATTALAQLYARTNFAAQDEAHIARDQVTGLLDGLIETASDAGGDDTVAALQNLYAAAANDLTLRGKRVPSTILLSVNDSYPALMLAQRFYGDPERAAELVARNGAVHPLFMPLALEVLTT
jgi:prophage DNA circulation protein